VAGELLLDTGPLVGLLDRRQSIHAACSDFYSQWQGQIVTSEAVITESIYLLSAARGGAAACIDSEVRAFRNSAQFWIQVFGADGKAGAASDLERQLNLIAQRELTDPASLESVVRQTYTAQCAH